MSVSGSKLPGASAWREGQKLARKLLGPPPAFPKLRSRAEEQSTGNAYGTAVLSATLLVFGTQTKTWLAVCGINGFKVILSKCKRFKSEFHCPCMLHSIHTLRGHNLHHLYNWTLLKLAEICLLSATLRI